MERIEFGRLSDEQRAELEGDEDDPFDGAGSPLQWRRKERHVAVRDQRGRLIASAGLLVVEVEVADSRFPVVGLGGVIVNRDHRGRGLALEVIQAALARARTLGPALIVLFCHADRVELYRRFGFAEVAAPVLVEHGGDHVAMPMRTMWRALEPGAVWPEGRVRVHSLPF